MVSGDKMYILSIIEIGPGVQKLVGGIHIQTDRREGDLIRLLNFSK
jgi:hypothetical protein